MKVTNKITGVPLVDQWTADENTLLITDDSGREWVIQASPAGGLRVMAMDGRTLAVLPRTSNTIDVRSEP